MKTQAIAAALAASLAVTAVLAQGSAALSPANADAAPAERVPIDIRRTTIIVRDIERSLKLYRDALGMKVNYDAPMSVSGPAFTQNGPQRPIRLVLLNANDPWIGWIGLLQYTDAPERPATPAPQHLAPGSHILVTAVADAQAACAAAAAAPGVRMMAPLKIAEYPSRTPGGAPIRVLGCQFFDADGAYLELNQTLAR
jgi:catechol 2,3-dioxygenase-like lactoylglutathione lyase family enzyme